MPDKQFTVHIISEICTYAKQNDMNPNETMRILCNNLLAMLETCTFNVWKEGDQDER